MVETLSQVNSRSVLYMYTEGEADVAQPLGPLFQLQFEGDQLTTEHARNSKRAVCNGSQVCGRLEALIPHDEVFHCSMNFVKLVYTTLYHTDSNSDVGTVYDSRNKLDRRAASRLEVIQNVTGLATGRYLMS